MLIAILGKGNGAMISKFWSIYPVSTWLMCCCLSASLPAQDIQDDNLSGATQENQTGVEATERELELEKRVLALETRLGQLESLLFSASQLTIYNAKRQLENSTERLEQSERLYLKGRLQKSRFDFDRFLVDRAKLELALATATDGHYQIVCEIDVLQAQFNLDVAQQSVEYNRRSLLKGYTSRDKMQRLENVVAEAEKTLQIAQKKLDDIKAAQPQIPSQEKPTTRKPDQQSDQ